LANTNVLRPKGQLTDGDRTWEIATNDQLHGAAQYRPLIISYVKGAPLRLSDVADVQDATEDLRTGGLSNGKAAVLLVLFPSRGATIVGTVARARTIIPQLQASLPAAISLNVVLDRTPPIRASLRDVELTLLIAVVLVILVVFAFLRNVRAA